MWWKVHVNVYKNTRKSSLKKLCENEHDIASKSVEKYDSSMIIQNIKISIFKKNGINK